MFTALLRRQATRNFSTTLYRRAAELPKIDPETFTRLRNTEVFKKIQSNPAVLPAILDFVNIMQQQGIDTSNGPPSMFQMSKLLLKPEIRDAATNLADAFKRAGIDITNKDTMQEIMALTNTKKPSGDN